MLHFRFWLLSCLFILVAVGSLHAQAPCTLQLTGKVVNAETGESLPFAGMYLREADIPTTTEEDGTFEFKKLCPNTSYHLEVHFLGHEEFHQNYVLTENTEVLIRLNPIDKVLAEVEIKAERVEEHTLEQATHLSATTLRQTRSQSLGKALESISGVRTLQSGPSVFKPVIHGLHSNRILIYQNDIRLEGQQWGTEHAPEIDPFQAERVAVLKGAPAVRYGAEAIGGVIVIDPPSLPTRPGWTGEINAGANSNGGMGTLSGQLAHGSSLIQGLGWRMQGTLKRAGDFSAPAYGLANTGLGEASVS